MPTILEEVPGAMERPGGCRIQIKEASDGSVTIEVPPRRSTPFLIVVAALLSINLLLALWTGVMALLFHHSVLLMSQISPQNLPVSMQRFEPVLWLGLIALLGIGFATVGVILRPLLTREVIQIDRNEIQHQRWIFRSVNHWQTPIADVRGFHLKRDPQGFSPSILILQTRAGERIIGEALAEADREWLASVGNALLRH